MKTLIIALLMATTAVAQESQNFPISSVFASEIPAVQKGQHVLQTHEYLACIDPERRQPVWVAYTVSLTDFETENVLSRNFTTPRQYSKISLEQSDYKSSGFDMGHMCALKHKAASRHASEVNWMVVIAAQSPNLNRGPFLKTEKRVRELAAESKVYVMTVCLFEGNQDQLPNSDEKHELPSHCGVMITKKNGDVECYLVPQECDINADLDDFSIPVEDFKDRVSQTWWTSEDR